MEPARIVRISRPPKSDVGVEFPSAVETISIRHVDHDSVGAQAIGQPSLIALSHVIQRKRADYYDALEAANKHNEVTAWLTYFAETV